MCPARVKLVMVFLTNIYYVKYQESTMIYICMLFTDRQKPVIPTT